MKSGIDFKYEYSDLNQDWSRVLVLTGEYVGLIVEFGPTFIVNGAADYDFAFDYVLYAYPEKHDGITRLRENKEFEKYLSTVVSAVMLARKDDKYEKNKKWFAAEMVINRSGTIKIDERFYPIKEEPLAA
jgi:hypothetical protein